ncbi:MAG TPA: hypothetical protein VNX87_01860 [Candidatus Sulfotelmatobacter sp.]|jgi:hypothetical protein|nr:hypothetical protein [Candidatus Sulfotelmatobacter sp.]
MRHRLCVGIIALAMILPAALAPGQAVSLQEQLVAQYQVAKVKADSSGYGVVDPGTLLTIQKSGVLAVPWRAMALCPAKYQDNAFHPSVGFCAGMLKDVSRYFQKGEKVYPTKIDVNLNKAKVSFTVVACDSCSGTNPATSMKGEVVFQFAKGYLEKAGVGDVEDAIGKVFLISDDNQQNDNQNQGNGSSQQPPQQQEAQQSEPATVQLGMTTDQVQSILGKPQKIFNVGAKQIYVYQDVKVTFQNGKVADVQ